MNKKKAKNFLEDFEKATGVKAVDARDYVLSSKFGDIKVTMSLKEDTVFTKLLHPKMEHEKFGFNPYSGKRNYHTEYDVHYFLDRDVVTGDIKKSDTAITAVIKKSMYDSTGENKMYDIAIYTGDEMTDSIICIDYMECTQTARNLGVTILEGSNDDT